MDEKNWRYVDTAEVPAWNVVSGEVEELFTELGAFVARRAERFVPYARRVEYAGSGRHHAKASRRPAAWFASKLRDAGDFLLGSFRFLEA